MQLTSYLSIAALSVLVFLTIILWVDSKRKSNLYLLLLLILLATHTLLRFSFLNQNTLVIFLPYIVFPSGFLFGPILFFYTRSILFAESPTRQELTWISCVSGLVLLLHLLLNWILPETLNPDYIYSMKGILENYTRMLLLTGNLYNIVWAATALPFLGLYQKACADNFSDSKREGIVWLRLLLYLNLALFSSYLLKTLTEWYLGSPFSPVSSSEGIVVLAVAYLVLFYYGKKPGVLSLEWTTIQQSSESGGKYSKQSLDESLRRELMRRIETYFETEKPYLEDHLNLQSAAEKLEIPPHHFSMTINSERNMSFYQFVNHYRVEEAKILLSDPNLRKETILWIAYQSGFQSKSVFNRVFKEETGLSPTEFRQKRIY